MSALEITIPGIAVPQGSMRLVNGGRRMIHSNKDLPAWRATMGAYTIAEIVRKERQTSQRFPLTGPVDLAVTFSFPRPRTHYRTGRFSDLLRTAAPRYMQVGPDLDKLVRAVGDALTAACAILDDKQIHLIHAAKRWADDHPPCTTITLWDSNA
jgi:crossover junction endodeoxyribonuclease RusA